MISTAKQCWEITNQQVPDDRFVDVSELVKITGLSKMTVTYALMYARERGLVEEDTITYIYTYPSGKREKRRKNIYRKRHTPNSAPNRK